LELVEERHQDALALPVERVEQADGPLPPGFRLQDIFLIPIGKRFLQVQRLAGLPLRP
jgi:hypothetical protein